MISFKFYVQTPFFSTFITLHLGKGHIQAVNRHSGPGGVCYGQFIVSPEHSSERDYVITDSVRSM